MVLVHVHDTYSEPERCRGKGRQPAQVISAGGKAKNILKRGYNFQFCWIRSGYVSPRRLSVKVYSLYRIHFLLPLQFHVKRIETVAEQERQRRQQKRNACVKWPSSAKSAKNIHINAKPLK